MCSVAAGGLRAPDPNQTRPSPAVRTSRPPAVSSAVQAHAAGAQAALVPVAAADAAGPAGDGKAAAAELHMQPAGSSCSAPDDAAAATSEAAGAGAVASDAAAMRDKGSGVNEAVPGYGASGALSDVQSAPHCRAGTRAMAPAASAAAAGQAVALGTRQPPTPQPTIDTVPMGAAKQHPGCVKRVLAKLGLPCNATPACSSSGRRPAKQPGSGRLVWLVECWLAGLASVCVRQLQLTFRLCTQSGYLGDLSAL